MPLPPPHLVELLVSILGEVDRPWAARAVETLDLATVSELDLAARTKRLRAVPADDGATTGPEGARREETVRGRLARGVGWVPPRLLDAGRRAATRVLDRLQREPSALRLSVVGDVRRMAPLVERVDLLATAHDDAALLEAFVTLPCTGRLLSRDAGSATTRWETGVPVRLEVVAEEAFAARHLFRTGPPAHVAAVVAAAAARGLTLDEDGLCRDGAPVALDDETALYRALDLPWVAPERREAPEALGEDAADLVAAADVRGVAGLLAGAAAADAMAARAAAEGYGWAVVVGGGPGRAQAGPEGFRRFAGALLVATPGGGVRAAGDPESADLVLGHVEGAAAGEDVTASLLALAADPRVDALRFPPGDTVLLGRRGPSYDADRVLDACVAHGVAAAPSGLPHRRTLDLAWHGSARARGLRLLPWVDAHDSEGVDQALWALADARRGGWPRRRVLTALDADAFVAWRRDRRRD